MESVFDVVAANLHFYPRLSVLVVHLWVSNLLLTSLLSQKRLPLLSRLTSLTISINRRSELTKEVSPIGLLHYRLSSHSLSLDVAPFDLRPAFTQLLKSCRRDLVHVYERALTTEYPTVPVAFANFSFGGYVRAV